MDKKLISLNELQLYVKSRGNSKNERVKTFLNNDGALSSVSNPEELLKNTSFMLKFGLNSSNAPSVSRVELNFIKPCTSLGKEKGTLSKSVFTNRLYGISIFEKVKRVWISIY